MPNDLTLEQLAWSSVEFQAGKPLLHAELNLLQQVIDYKRRRGSAFEADWGFLRKTQSSSALSDYSFNTTLAETSPLYGTLGLSTQYLLIEGELVKIPQITITPADVGSVNKLFYLEVNLNTLVSSDTVSEFGFVSGSSATSSLITDPAVGTPTAVRRQVQSQIKSINHSSSYFNRSISGFSLSQNGLLRKGSPDSYTYAIPLCLIFRRGSGAFNSDNLNSAGSGHFEGKKLTPIYPEDILDLRNHVFLSQFSFEQELENQLSLLENNKLKTWALSSADMGLSSDTIPTGTSEVSVTPLVRQKFISFVTDSYKNSVSDRVLTYKITNSTALTGTTAVYKSGNDLLIDPTKYYLDYFSGGTLSVQPDGKIKLTGFFSATSEAYVTELAREGFLHPRLQGTPIYNNGNSVPGTGGVFPAGGSPADVVYRAVAPQAIGSGLSQNNEFSFTLTPVYTPDFLYVTSVGRFSSNQSSEFSGPSDQIILSGTGGENLPESTLSGSGSLISTTFATEEGFVKLPLVKKSLPTSLFRLVRSFNSTGPGQGGIDGNKRSYYELLDGAVELHAESLLVGTPRKVFYPFLAKVGASSTQTLLPPGEVVLVIASQYQPGSALNNYVSSVNNSSFRITLYRTQNLWKLI